MYKLLIKQFLRLRTTYLAFGLLLILGGISIAIGKQFLGQQQQDIVKTYKQQEQHLEEQIKFHPDDLGYLIYYTKFFYINSIDNLAGIAIGQRDLNANIQKVGMTSIGNQKYNTDLVNPMRLQVGNLDLSFVIIFLFPLVIIAISFNLLSEEVEKGTWKMIRVQGKSPFSFLLSKLSVRFLMILSTLLSLFLLAKIVLDIPFDSRYFIMIILSVLYLLFWFSVVLLIVSFRKNSNFNAISLLTLWLVLVILLPVAVNKFITNKYPIGEALTMTIKQRDGYHKKWDLDKNSTMQKFYKIYPQFNEYKVKQDGFSWQWYYAMQQIGDEEAKPEQKAMLTKVRSRQRLSEIIADFIPPIKIQLAMNEIAQTGLKNYLSYLNAMSGFHKEIRNEFYPKLFENLPPSSINLKEHKPVFFESSSSVFHLLKAALPIIIMSILLVVIGIFRLRKI